MTWQPITPSGFIAVPTPREVRRLIPSRFGSHLFAPLSDAGGPRKLLCLSLRYGRIHFHTSAVVSDAECGADAMTLYDRFVLPATTSLDARAKKMADKVAA